MSTQDNPQLLSISGIRYRCKQETSRFFNQLPYDPLYCFELFRRALEYRNDLAWEYIYEQYRPLVASWVENHPQFLETGAEVQDFLTQTFTKLWQSMTPAKFKTFTDLRAILRYLKMCAHSVITDYARKREQRFIRNQVLSPEPDNENPIPAIPDTSPPVEESVIEQDANQVLWRWIEQQCKNEKEHTAVYGTFVLGLKPRQVAQEYPRIFHNAAEVSRVKDNLISRLRRNPDMAQFL
ncbi:MAG TPA: sigma-70 family RNA polymerase sigma factor [Anaerolineae bacterium]|nr:sigma-70 family RNA polymerase sigma factor [Anaerolineae bacterium]HIP73755.1 sigma-70 family RNA polymerase sigma factor [Anaerolineae bacterium]